MRGDNGWNSAVLRTLLGKYDYGGAVLPMRNGLFSSNLNEFKPESYPEFTFADIGASNTGPEISFSVWWNRGTGRCLDLDGGSIGNGADILQYECHGASNQVGFVERIVK